jgi:hypothetical protein
MYPKLIVAVALFGAMSTSAFAEWNLVSKVGVGGCAAVERAAGPAENQVGGPYQTQAEAEEAKQEFAACATSSQ